MDMTFSLPLTGRTDSLMRSLTAVTPVTTTRAIAHNRPFCDGYHIVKAKPAMWVYSSKWANGKVPCLLPLFSGSTCGETGHLRLAPLLYQGRPAHVKMPANAGLVGNPTTSARRHYILCLEAVRRHRSC